MSNKVNVLGKCLKLENGGEFEQGYIYIYTYINRETGVGGRGDQKIFSLGHMAPVLYIFIELWAFEKAL